MITIISNSMMNWKTALTFGGTDLGEVDITIALCFNHATTDTSATKDESWMQTCKGHEARQPSTVHGRFEIAWNQQRPTRLTSTSGKDVLARHQEVVWTRLV